MLGLLLNTRVMGAVAGAILLIGLTAGIYFKGVRDERAKWERRQLEAELQATKAAREKERTAEAEAQKVSSDYESKIREIHNNYGAWVDTLSLRLRKNSDGNLPKAPGTAAESDAASSRAGDGAREINLDESAKRIAELGRDLDACGAQVIGLQEVVAAYVREVNEPGNRNP